MTDTNQLPPLPVCTHCAPYPGAKEDFLYTADQMRAYALQARAQVQGEPVLTVEKEPDYWSGGHFHKGSKPHINPMKVWSMPIGTKLYTAPQPAQATQAVPMTDAVAYAIHQVIKPSNMTDSDWHSGAMLGHENEYREKVEQAATRAILALSHEPVAMTDEVEKCAVVAWAHFMDTCRKKRISPADWGDWCAADAIRKAHQGITAQAKGEQ